jgi:hypothetical protein
MERLRKMTFWKKLREKTVAGVFRRSKRIRKPLVWTTVEADGPGERRAQAAAEPMPAPDLRLDREIDFSRVRDLETYTENLDVPEKSIEQWISAGLLYPEEIRIAERMIKIIRKKRR